MHLVPASMQLFVVVLLCFVYPHPSLSSSSNIFLSHIAHVILYTLSFFLPLFVGLAGLEVEKREKRKEGEAQIKITCGMINHPNSTFMCMENEYSTDSICHLILSSPCSIVAQTNNFPPSPSPRAPRFNLGFSLCSYTQQTTENLFQCNPSPTQILTRGGKNKREQMQNREGRKKGSLDSSSAEHYYSHHPLRMTKPFSFSICFLLFESRA